MLWVVLICSKLQNRTDALLCGWNYKANLLHFTRKILTVVQAKIAKMEALKILRRRDTSFKFPLTITLISSCSLVHHSWLDKSTVASWLDFPHKCVDFSQLQGRVQETSRLHGYEPEKAFAFHVVFEEATKQFQQSFQFIRH